MSDMDQALNECDAYNRTVGLDDTMMRDIAFDYDVSYEEMKRIWEEPANGA